MPYVVAFLAAALIVTLLVAPWGLNASQVLVRGGDYTWQQAMVQVFAQSGPFGSTEHLAWPIGVSGWTLPQMGLLQGTLSWILSGLFGIPTIVVVFLLLAVSAGLTATACLFLFRPVVRGRFVAVAVVLAVGLSVTVLSTFAVLNLAMWYLVPVTLAFLFRFEGSSRRRRKYLVVGLAGAAVLSPLWWVVMMAVFLPVVVLAPLAHRRWEALRGVLVGAGVIWGALILQALLMLAHTGPGADQGRDNIHVASGSGILSDLLVGSDLQRLALPGSDQIASGLSQVGTPVNLLAFGCVVWLLSIPMVGRRPERLLQVSAALVSALFFVVGGLGSLTVLAATVLGVTTPARGFRFFVLGLALIATVVALGVMSRRWEGKPSSWEWVPAAGLVLAFAVLILGDWAVTHRRDSYETAPAREVAVTDYLSSALDPCPVAQLPQEILPSTRVTGTPVGSSEIYRAMIPYVLEPGFFWSYGSFAPDQSVDDNPLNGIDQVLDDKDLEYLADAGYCALLFDTELSETARAADVALEGRDLRANREPDYADSNYSVFLLNG